MFQWTLLKLGFAIAVTLFDEHEKTKEEERRKREEWHKAESERRNVEKERNEKIKLREDIERSQHETKEREELEYAAELRIQKEIVNQFRNTQEWKVGCQQLYSWLGQTEKKYKPCDTVNVDCLVVAIDIELGIPELIHIALPALAITTFSGELIGVETHGRIEDAGILSIGANTPVGNALIGKQVGTIASVHSPGGKYDYIICDVIALY